MTTRLDYALVSRGLVSSRTKAADLIKAGAITVDDAIITKPSYLVEESSLLCVLHNDPWVSRAAHKLLHALLTWPQLTESITGHTCIDVGASTGGFTQVLLNHGAAHVIALDVGHEQLHPTLSTDTRVTDLSGTTIRGIDPHPLGGPFPCVVTDLSFISLAAVMPELAALTGPDGFLIALVKPQFEVGKDALGKNGIVSRSEDRLSALRSVAHAATHAGLRWYGGVPSPITGRHGNHEYVTVWTHAATTVLLDDRLEATLQALVTTHETKDSP